MKGLHYVFHDEGHMRRFCWGIVFLMFFCYLGMLFMQSAAADSGDVAICTSGANMFAIGGDGAGSAIGSATGYGASASGATCDNEAGIFARILCIFRTTIGQIMAQMYCNFNNALKGPLQIAIDLVVVIFGILLITGNTSLETPRLMMMLLKVVLIWVFATNADFGIGIAYKFFMGVAEQGADIVLSVLNAATGVTVSINQPDTLVTTIFNYISGSSSAGGGASNILTTALSALPSYCGQMMMVILVGLMVSLPMVGNFVFMLIGQYVFLYARAMLGYLTVLVLMSFLFALSPLFLSFALFRTTMHLFERWIKYLTTYSIQMIIVFAFLGLLQFVPITSFITEVLSMLRLYDVSYDTWFFAKGERGCTICTYDVAEAASGATSTCDASASASGYYPGTCIPAKTLVCTAASPGSDATASDGLFIPLEQLMEGSNAGFVVFIFSQVIALWLIGIVLREFFKQAPEFARQLGGNVAGALAIGGAGSKGGPQFAGMQAVQAGFQGMRNGFYGDYGVNPLSAFPRRITGMFSGAMDGFLNGADDLSDPTRKERDLAVKRSEVKLQEFDTELKKQEELLEKAPDAQKKTRAQQNIDRLKADRKREDMGRQNLLKKARTYKGFLGGALGNGTADPDEEE